jgi:hypothetical protein
MPTPCLTSPLCSTSGPSPEELTKSLAASEAAHKELQARVERLEGELADKRRQHNEDVAGLQGGWWVGKAKRLQITAPKSSLAAADGGFMGLLQ